MANGYIETQERIADRWSRWSFEAAKVETCLRQTSEAEADKLHELIIMCNTDPAHTATALWQIEAEAQAADANDWMQQTNELRHG